MKRLTLLAFLAMAVMLTAAPKKKAHKNPTKAGVFDYYVMSLSWAPDFCKGKAPDDECGKHRGFVLHGLWPENFNGTYPEFCPTTKTAAPSLIPDMPAAIVPHEWLRHGACDVPGGAPADFFRKADNDFRSVKIPAQFQHSTAPLTLKPTDVVQTFAAANGTGSSGSFVPACAGSEVDVRVCLNKSGALTQCRIKSDCAATRPLTFLPTN